MSLILVWFRYIYDYKGVEIHCMKRHENPLALDFLPYHFLLNSIGQSGWIKWHDISIGEYVAGYNTGFGPAKVLKHNPANGVSHVGHFNGVVTLWSPAAGKALASIFCHKSPVNDLAIDREGKYLVTAGADGMVKVNRALIPTLRFLYSLTLTVCLLTSSGICGNLLKYIAFSQTIRRAVWILVHRDSLRWELDAPFRS